MFESMQKVAGVTFVPRAQAEQLYGVDTGGAVRRLLGAVVVQNGSAVGEIVRLANVLGVKLWPISGGRNFGYGTSLPVADDSLILDMRSLKGITHHSESQCVTIEPGVTQSDLADFFDQHELDYLVPTTGAGPNGSLIGNALDAGYGLTPTSDHFVGMSRLEGVWGSGERFTHSFDGLDCDDMARRWSGGLGPDVKGLLRQGNLGVVTSATLQLVRRPEAARLVILRWKSDADFFASQDALSRLMEEIPQLTGILSMTSHRAIASMAGSPLATAPVDADQRRVYLDGVAKKRGMAAWFGLGTLFGSAGSISGAAADIKRRLPLAKVMVLSPAKVRAIGWVAKAIPAGMADGLKAQVQSLQHSMGMLEGRPVAEFLSLAYSLSREPVRMDASRNPAWDGQGLLWFAPLVPLDGQKLKQFTSTVGEVLERHGFASLLAATARNSRLCTCTVPLLFNKTPADIERASVCYEELVRVCVAMGMPPYRLGIDFMSQLQDQMDVQARNTGASLKRAFDPRDVIAPGRYLAPLAVEQVRLAA